MKQQLTLVAALGRNRAIGLDGRMPWHLPAELQHFKRTTMGKALVMGRKTWQAIGRPLPGRQNIVVSRNPLLEVDGIEVAGSLREALQIANSQEVMVIGGGQLYEQAMPLADRMVLTLIDIEPEADTWFPDWDDAQWERVAEQHFEADEKNPLAYCVIELERV
ncbi:MAG: type 3 dihydrofolate reductase [Xanthomonadales bacterium]|nr:type 3 dihydrofolate reductase [Xanthomonadales bacterium]